MQSMKRLCRQVPRAVRKPLVFVVGFLVVLAGIAMLVLPGPGWATIFLGFAILATEFAFATKVRNWLMYFLKRLMHHGKRAAKYYFEQTNLE